MKCPNCDELLLPGSKKCGDCGWQAKKEKAAPVVVDHKCEWHSGNMCCPAMGTMSDSIKGGGPWFCRWHFFNRNDFNHSLRITEDMIKNGVPNTDWREEAMKMRMMKEVK